MFEIVIAKNIQPVSSHTAAHGGRVCLIFTNELNSFRERRETKQQVSHKVKSVTYLLLTV